ncbi:MAG TPA: VCBS repeat-containing protein, partial [Puia sp.]|nr:VCBS repeat-containing protein [Puia sp.]
MFRYTKNNILFLFLPAALFAACHGSGNHPRDPVFKVLDHSQTNLDFSNTLHPTRDFNVFDYMYYYNGGGIGAGDFNNDGKIDLFFASNQEKNKLYLNDGGLRFHDVTDSAEIPQDGGWSTGVSVVDINNDGLLDIYVCKVGRLDGLPVSHNQLLICQGIGKDGIPRYRDEAKEYGLDFSGFSTQAAFFDYDGDGDLDMYLMNHSIHQNGTFGPRQEKLATTSPLTGDRLYRNDGNGKFTDVTHEAGIHSSVIGYGLGLAVSDIDLDGYPDIYVGNDFHENDYLYINRHDGTFSDELNDKVMHTSQYTMGVDIADANNDGFPEIVTMDMLPYDPYILKRSEGEDTWDVFHLKIGYGYNYQYTRNNLQYNRRNGHFSEIGLYSGIAATDWSWSPLWVDFDNDGRKDLFISNGIPKRLNDIDYINFISNQELQRKIEDRSMSDKDIDMINKFPEIKLPSRFFRNEGNMTFANMGDSIDGIHPTYSNGAVYADLDGDGDLDIVVNNIDEPALIYQNLESERTHRPSVDIALKGPDGNSNALGAKVFLFTNGEIRSYEKYPVRGFMSSAETPLHIGLYQTPADSAFLVWPDNSFQRITLSPHTGPLLLRYAKGLPKFDYSIVTGHWKNPSRPATDITQSTRLLYRHVENSFHEFDREPLLPHMLSTEGPATAVGDINHDGLDDVFIGAAKWQKPAVFVQDRAGKFTRLPEPDLDKDSTYEDVDACWTDVNNDGAPDLVVASGGNEYFGQEPWRSPRVYLNDGKGSLA